MRPKLCISRSPDNVCAVSPGIATWEPLNAKFLSASENSSASIMLKMFTLLLLLLSLQSCLTQCDPIDGSPPGSSVPGILQGRILEWVAIPFSKGSSRPRDQTQVSCVAGRLFTVWATREARDRLTRGNPLPSTPTPAVDLYWWVRASKSRVEHLPGKLCSGNFVGGGEEVAYLLYGSFAHIFNEGRTQGLLIVPVRYWELIWFRGH